MVAGAGIRGHQRRVHLSGHPVQQCGRHAVLGGLAVSAIFGVLVGLAVGVDPQTTIMKYVLPIMGDGNGCPPVWAVPSF